MAKDEGKRAKGKGKDEKYQVQIANQSSKLDIRERAFIFATRLVKLCRHLEERPGVGRTLGHQLLRAGTSVGANVEEAQAAQSRADFIHKNAIALKEARETHYWLRLLEATNSASGVDLSGLRAEVSVLMKILGAIIVSAKKSPRRDGRESGA